MQLKKLERALTGRIRKLKRFKLPRLRTVIVVIVLFFVSLLVISGIYIIKMIDLPSLMSPSNNLPAGDMMLRLAEENYINGHLENSALYYRNYIATEPGKTEEINAYRKLFQIYIISREFLKAEDTLESILEIDRRNYQSVLDLIKLHIRTEDYGKALRVINSYKRRMSRSPEFVQLYAVYLIKQGDLRAALKELKKIRFTKRSFSYNALIISVMIKSNRFQEAIDYSEDILKKAYFLDDNNTIFHLNMLSGIACIEAGQLNKAKRYISELQDMLLSLDNTPLQLLLHLAIITNSGDDLLKLVNSYQDAIESDRDTAVTVGYALTYMGIYDKAAEIFGYLNSLDQLKYEEKLCYSDVLFELKSYSEAIDMLQSIYAQDNQRKKDILVNISTIYSQTGDITQQIFFLKQALDEDRNNPDTLFRLGVAHYLIGDRDAALRYSGMGIALINDPQSLVLKKLVALKTLLVGDSAGREVEIDLLALREQSANNFESTLSLIGYYTEKMLYNEAKRELRGLRSMNLSVEQKNIADYYELKIAMKTGDRESYSAIIGRINSVTDAGIEKNIAQSAVYILERRYRDALSLLNTIESNQTGSISGTVFYMKAICYYYERDFYTASRMAEFAARELGNRPIINFLRSAINSNM